ncbi:hypothetical protein ACFWH7_03445 [Cellulosimicrobium cellulans]|uniref:hypothetical protein n=1 Tax=Cellulosimicrobium cellulans TaxID=1710 RepID=UPI00364B4DA5
MKDFNSRRAAEWPTCPHGERTDKRTKNDEPLCPFCRREERRLKTNGWTGPPLDVPALAAHDDTLFDPIEGEPS